ncbi:MAG TPA: glutamyl-tRNA reductase, partial [Solirubrobacteraceae bacterium]
PGARSEEFLRELLGAGAEEAVAISTCNRTEIYLVAGDPVAAESDVLGALARRAGIGPTELAPSVYARRNCEAARHLFRVASGLESMVVGEAEVQGQVKRAFDDGLAAGTTGTLTNHLFRAALETGKRVRTETRLGAGHASMSSVAVKLAHDVVGDLAGREVVILGAGETSELTARALAEQGVNTLFVVNRRRQRGLELAQRFGGRAAGFDELPAALQRADIVVSATSSPHFLLEAEEVAQVLGGGREERPLLMIDLAVPRDIEPECGDVAGVRLFDVDDLEAVVRRNRMVRRGEARTAEGLVEEEIQRFAAWLGSLEVRPTIAALQARGEDVVRQVLAENAGRWESLSDRDRERMETMAKAIARRLLHEPTLRMKRMDDDDRIHLRMQVLRELFALEEPGADAGLAEVRELPRRRTG